jgi:cytochrome P450
MPGTDLISALVAAHDEAESLNGEELLAFVVLLLLAGSETTTTTTATLFPRGRSKPAADALPHTPLPAT